MKRSIFGLGGAGGRTGSTPSPRATPRKRPTHTRGLGPLSGVFFFSFAIHFVVNIVNQPTDKELVLTPNSIRKILDGLDTTWTDPDIIVDNDWISTISPKPGIVKVRLLMFFDAQ